MINRISTYFKEITLNKLFYIIASLFFLINATFAIYYFKERSIYIDSSLFIFKIITFESFNYEAYRFGVFITQILPLIAIKLGLSLKYVLLIFSLSFIVVEYLVFLFCYHKLKEKTISFIIPVSLIIGISHGYFYSFTEIYQAIVYVALFYAWVNTRFKEKNTTKIQFFNITIAFVLFLLCFFTHPTSVFPILFIIGYHTLYYKQNWKNGICYLIPLVVLVAIIKIVITKSSSYEGNLFNDFIHSPTLLKDILSLYTVKFIYRNLFFNIYTIPLLLVIILITNYIYRKQYLLLCYFLVTFVLFGILLSLTFYKGDDDIVMEKTFTSLLLFVIIPFTKEIVYYNQNFKLLKSLLFVVIIIIGFAFIQRSGKIYQSRISYIKSLLQYTRKQHCNKFLIEQKDLNEIVRIPWAFSVECLLYSAMETPTDQRTIFIVKDKNEFSKIDLTDSTQYFIVPFLLKWNHPLNKKYFNLKPCPYSWLKLEEVMKNKNYRILKDYKFDSNLSDIELTNSTNLRNDIKSIFILKPDEEYGLTYQSELKEITSESNPVFLINTSVFAKENIQNEDLFLVLSIENGNKLVYYQKFDLANDIKFNEWIEISKIFNLISIEPTNTLKIYFWNSKHKTYYINKMTISVSE